MVLGKATMMVPGTLHGVGVGPGAPDLITLRAFRLITGAPVIAYPAPDSGESFARSIVSDMLHPGKIEIPIIIPMRSERYPAAEVYDRAAAEIASQLDAGKDVVLLCEGDPFFYGSYMYVHDRLADRYHCEVVPGVTSPLASSAVLGLPLVSRNDVLTVVPGPNEDASLRAQIEAADVTVIMKVGRHAKRIIALLDEMSLLDCAHYAERVTIDGAEFTCPLAELGERNVPYFSMIIVQRKTQRADV
ncbi:MAG: precorrin-2 C(20)-methyltransferase [Pseudomonadota bacterium]